MQRVVKVCTNSTGAYSALRVDVKPNPIAVVGNSLAEDIAGVRPFVVHHTVRSLHVDDAPEISSLEDKLAALSLEKGQDFQDEEEEDAPVDASLRVFTQLLGVVATSKHRNAVDMSRAHGADVLVRCGIDIPVHRIVLESRCSTLAQLFTGKKLVVGAIKLSLSSDGVHIDVTGCHPLSVLIMMHYLYADNIPAFWDRRVGSVLSEQVVREGTTLQALREEVETLARLLMLDPLLVSLASASQRVPAPTMSKQFSALFSKAQSALASQERAGHPRAESSYDIVLELSDREVACHSAILRGRSPLFASFLDDEDWTARRWQDGILRVDFKHLEWRHMELVFKFVYCGEEMSMFDRIGAFATMVYYQSDPHRAYRLCGIT